MKTIYSLIVSVLFVGSSYGQVPPHLSQTLMKPAKADTSDVSRSITKRHFGVITGSQNSTTTNPDRAIIWSDDFSNPSNWVIANTVGNSDNWIIGTTAPNG